jgi:hypothetical protein
MSATLYKCVIVVLISIAFTAARTSDGSVSILKMLDCRNRLAIADTYLPTQPYLPSVAVADVQ